MSTTQDAGAGSRPAAVSPGTAPPPERTAQPAGPARLPAGGTLLGLRVAQVVTWELAAAAVLAAWHHDSAPLLYAAGGAAAVLLVLTLARRQGRWLYQWLGLRLGYRRRRRPVPLPPGDDRLGPVRTLLPALAVDSVTGRRGQVIGLVGDGAGWVAVLDLAGDPGLLAAASPTPLAVPFGPLVAALSTEDIQLSTVQLVVHTAPAGHGQPPALQAGWLALRVSAETALTGAGRSAGTGKAGLERVQRALRRGVDRAVETLHSLGVAAQPLDSDGVRSALGLATAARPATAGTPAEPAAEHWTGWQCAGAGHACYAVHDWPPSGLAALLGALATVPAHAVTLAVTVAVDRQQPALTGAVRITDQTIEAARRAGDAADRAVASTGARLRPLDGQHAAAIIATLPLGATQIGATQIGATQIGATQIGATRAGASPAGASRTGASR